MGILVPKGELQQSRYKALQLFPESGNISSSVHTQHHKVRKQVQLHKSFVVSTLVHGFETWTLLADSEKKIEAFETKCLKKLLHISYLEHKTNNWVRSKINFFCVCATGTSSGNSQEKETQMVWAYYAPRQPLQHHRRSAEELLLGQHQRVDISAHAGTAHDGLEDWKKISAESSPMSPDDPIDRGTEVNWSWLVSVLNLVNHKKDFINGKTKHQSISQLFYLHVTKPRELKWSPVLVVV